MAEIKDANYKIVGYIEQGSGKLVAKDKNFRILGYYDPKNNQTTDSNFKLLAHGDILSALIWESR